MLVLAALTEANPEACCIPAHGALHLSKQYIAEACNTMLPQDKREAGKSGST